MDKVKAFYIKNRKVIGVTLVVAGAGLMTVAFLRNRAALKEVVNVLNLSGEAAENLGVMSALTEEMTRIAHIQKGGSIV